MPKLDASTDSPVSISSLPDEPVDVLREKAVASESFSAISDVADEAFKNPIHKDVMEHEFGDKKPDDIALDSLVKLQVALREELKNDPMKMGYEGKTTEEIYELLTKPHELVELVPVLESAPIARIIQDVMSEEGLDLAFSIQFDANGVASVSIPVVDMKIKHRVEEELLKPEYKDKSEEEKKKMLGEARVSQKEVKKTLPCRWNVITSGIPFVPNEIKPKELVKLL